jgi:hypothetical protein
MHLDSTDNLGSLDDLHDDIDDVSYQPNTMPPLASHHSTEEDERISAATALPPPLEAHASNLSFSNENADKETNTLSNHLTASPGSGGMVSPENPALSPQPTTAAATENQSTSATADSDFLKSTSYQHLQQKYLSELEYMLTEFQKLERQLLGAKAATRESAGSKERREKLHSFIVHLDDTIQQIHAGCCSETTEAVMPADPVGGGDDGDDEILTEEESVQKLEEHILANLLPVKVRLKKQLAAQQGAKHNPAGMPTRGSAGVASGTTANEGKATFVARVKPADSHYGKPLSGGGSSLTKKLHGPTLGSAGMEAAKPPASNKILFAGMAIGSDQMESSVHAANSVHRLVIEDRAMFELRKLQHLDEFSSSNPDFVSSTEMGVPKSSTTCPPIAAPAVASDALEKQRRIRLLRRRKKRKRQKKRELLQQQKLQLSQEPALKKRKAIASACPTKRGPRAVEYICSLCNEVYQSSCEFNTWWALSQQECPKCRKGQVRSQ